MTVAAVANRVFGRLENQETLLKLIVLTLASVVAFSVRLFAVIRYESVIHEFDPYFNYRTTKYLSEEGYYKFHNWFDSQAWYPLGRIIGGTIYPGLMVTSTLIFRILHLFNITIDIREVCVFLAPLFSSFTVIVTYFFTKEIQSEGAGLVAAALIAVVPGYISRSVAGSYDNEGIAIFCMLLTYYLWIKAVKSGSIFHGAMCSLAYFYMVSSWGGYVFLINLIPLHVLTLICTGRFSHRVYIAYSTTYTLGTILSMQIPFVGFQPVLTSEHMGAFGVFGLCQIIAFAQWMKSKMSPDRFQLVLNSILFVIGGAGVLFLVVASFLHRIAPWTGRFYSLLDPSYAKNNIPIIASVSEHQPTAWSSFYFDLQFLVFTFPAGIYFCLKNLNDQNIFAILYGLTSIYFSGVMVRLMLVLAPIMCILGGIAVSNTLFSFIKNIDGVDEKKPQTANLNRSKSEVSSKNVKKYKEDNYPYKSEIATAVVGMLTVFLISYVFHCTWVTSDAYSSPSIVLSAQSSHGRVIFDDFREAYYWLRQNTPDVIASYGYFFLALQILLLTSHSFLIINNPFILRGLKLKAKKERNNHDAKIMSWWDYGYQIAAMANRTVLVDNNTWNNTHISRVGQAMSSNESHAYEIMHELDVDYVLILFGGVTGYSSDDINKFLWMVRIGGSTPEGAHIKEHDYYTTNGEFRIDRGGSQTLLNCLMYKLSFYRFGAMFTEHGRPTGYDRVRHAEIGNKDFELEHLEEAYTTEHWLVRIYRVLKPSNRR